MKPIILFFICFFSCVAYTSDNKVNWKSIDTYTQNRISELLFEKIMSEDFSKAKHVYHDLVSNSQKAVSVDNDTVTVYGEDFVEKLTDSISASAVLRAAVGSNVIYSKFVEARVRKADSVPSSSASIAGTFHAGEYQKISARHVVYRQYDHQSMDPVYDFYHMANWPKVNAFKNGDNFELTEETNEVLIDARRLPYLEVIGIFKTDSKTQSIDIDSEPFKIVHSHEKNIISVELPAGFYGIASKRYIKKVNEGDKLFKRLHRGFTVQY